MWRIYSNPDSHGAFEFGRQNKRYETVYTCMKRERERQKLINQLTDEGFLLLFQSLVITI
jgi:hypothetical protein